HFAMSSQFSRREFLAGVGFAAGASLVSPLLMNAASSLAKSPFKIAVINDEISQDFGRACEVASKQFGMQWMELRSMWDKNIVALDEKEIAEAQRILKKYEIRVTDIASPLFKVDWPNAPKSKFSPKHDQFNASYGFEKQDEVLERSIALT